jgi:hypothetical protein
MKYLVGNSAHCGLMPANFLRLDQERYAFEMNDTVKIRSFRSGLTLAGQ